MFQDTPSICIPIFKNNTKHPSDAEIVGLYLYMQDGDIDFINFSHPDKMCSSISIDDIQLHPKSLVLNKKGLAYLGIDWGIDLNSYLQYYIDDTIKIEDFYPKSFDHFYAKFYNHSSVSNIIPLSKIIEYCENIVLFVLPYWKPSLISDKCVSFTDDFVSVFHEIESNSVLVGDEFKKQNYMWHTATSRPSNAWNNFNFAALNKNDGTRDRIRSRFENGKIVQFDYDAFHIKLLAKILDYKFTKHPYEEIKEELNLDIPYDEVKSRVFQNIYGTITDQFLQHPFFLRVQAMIDELYNEYTEHGYIESYFYGKRFREIENPTPNKVFNYFLQSLETEYNVRKIKNILPIIRDSDSVFTMYLYDAFIFEIPSGNDGIELIETLKRSFETDGMTVKVSIGDNFGNLKPYLYAGNH